MALTFIVLINVAIARLEQELICRDVKIGGKAIDQGCGARGLRHAIDQREPDLSGLASSQIPQRQEVIANQQICVFYFERESISDGSREYRRQRAVDVALA